MAPVTTFSANFLRLRYAHAPTQHWQPYARTHDASEDFTTTATMFGSARAHGLVFVSGWWWVGWFWVACWLLGWWVAGWVAVRTRSQRPRVPEPIGFINTRCRTSWVDIQLSTVEQIRSDQLTGRQRDRIEVNGK